jgi:hypothetical protein
MDVAARRCLLIVKDFFLKGGTDKIRFLSVRFARKPHTSELVCATRRSRLNRIVTLKEIMRLLSDVDGVVAVAREFDVQAIRIIDFSQGREYGREIHLALAEGQVFMLAAFHVFDVYVE